jgi:hypothetical protein
MSLDVNRLEKPRTIGGGVVQARCPACAEMDHDRKAQHLRMFPDGRFGCCAYPKDPAHRKRIFALAGDRTPRRFTVRIAPGNLGTLPALSVRTSLTAFFGTLGTEFSRLLSGEAVTADNSGTLGTGHSMSRAYAREDDYYIELKDNERDVPSVPRQQRLPHLTPAGDLIIPFDSPERYHWWKSGGQSVKQTLAEISERTKEVENGATF